MTEKEDKKLTKDQLKVVALRQRIGELTSQYEEQIADLRADVTQRFEAYDEVIRNQENDIESLQSQLRMYQDAAVQEEGSTATSGTTDTATTDYSDKD
jgi:small-conductance mechanosensitive channel